MESHDDYEVRLAATIAAMHGTLDPSLAPCPDCGAAELRAEVKAEWRLLTEAAANAGVTPAAIVLGGARLDGFGRVRCAVPYVTCMACGLHADASRRPIELT